MTSIACNVVLLPGQDIAQEAVRTSGLLADRGVLFTLAEGAYYPHLSIYMLQLKTDDFPRVEQLLAGVAAKMPVLSLQATRYWQSKQFADVEYYKTDEVDTLQQKVISALNPIRDGMRVKDEARMGEATGLKLENFKKYGWESVGELYRPHLTLTRFKQEQNIEELPLPALSEFSGIFTAIGLFEMGDNGTCVRKIATFELETT